MRLLLLDHHKTTAGALRSLYTLDEVVVATHASHAVSYAADWTPDVVVVELTLGGHSGLEFLYEFRTYKDWQTIPVIIYSSILLPDHILHTRAWEQLGVERYLYKPQTSLKVLKQTIDKYTRVS